MLFVKPPERHPKDRASGEEPSEPVTSSGHSKGSVRRRIVFATGLPHSGGDHEVKGRTAPGKAHSH